LAEYLHFAVEMRRRVKEQLRRINPEEFKKCDLSFVDKETGNEVVVLCPEYAQSGTLSRPSTNMPARRESCLVARFSKFSINTNCSKHCRLRHG